MMLFMSKYSKNINFFVLIKKNFLMFYGRFMKKKIKKIAKISRAMLKS